MTDSSQQSEWKCPQCGFVTPTRGEECLKCGIVFQKLFQRDFRRGMGEDQLILKYQITPMALSEWMKGVPADCLAKRERRILIGTPTAAIPSPPPRRLTAREDVEPLIQSSDSKMSIGAKVVVGAVLLLFMVALFSSHPIEEMFLIDNTSPRVEDQERVPPQPPPPVIIPQPVEYRRTNPSRVIQQAEEIAMQYRRTHTYSLEDRFVCVEMAMDVWNQLITSQIEAYLRLGNAEEDLRRHEKYSPEYCNRVNHACEPK